MNMATSHADQCLYARRARSLFEDYHEGIPEKEKDRWIQEAANILRRWPETSPAAAAEPAGWKLVPMEPTLGMGWAYLGAANDQDPARGHSFNHDGYRAMVIAAPTFPSTHTTDSK